MPSSNTDNAMCLDEHTWQIAELAKYLPAEWHDENKKLVAGIAGDDSDEMGDISVSRWKLKSLPTHVTICQNIQPNAGFFQYSVPDDDAVHWYMNFADPNVFAYYGGRLLAQDELQVVEHPILASVHRALAQGIPGKDNLTQFTKEQGREATPILVRNALRRCALDTREIYGDKFCIASKQSIQDAVTKLTPPTHSNILALSAVEPNYGMYTIDQIGELFQTAYTGFRAIVLASEKPVVLHTGHWGCGAFGGNKGLVAAIQLLAAGSAGVSKVCYWYGFTELDKTAVMHGIKVANILNGQALANVCELLDSAGYSWGDANENHVPFEPPANCLIQRMNDE